MEYRELNNGNKIPVLGLGTYLNTKQQDIIKAIETAYQHGIRLIDTAEIYRNEEQIGNAIKKLNIDRKKLFITSKVWNSEHGFDTTISSFKRSLENLQTDYLDLYLIHWPSAEKFIDSWKAMEQLYEQGLIKNIGVSNFHKTHLEQLLQTAKITPAVNQIELHPYLIQKDLNDFCRQQNIVIESWSPIAKGKVADDYDLLKIAYTHGKSQVQITLRWHLQNGFISIPKSTNPKHIREFSNVFNFELTEKEMQIVSNLNKNLRVGPNPDTYNF
ncbi:MAG: aldo/keto reductase [Bacteroidota bacterium]|nr:aldo/keto reductase [Bacteroidota bacterium]